MHESATHATHDHAKHDHAKAIEIDVYADLVCPWCYIGLRRLDLALERHVGALVTRRWRPFQLRPDMPKGGRPWSEFARDKFGGEARAAEAFQHVTELGGNDGIDFRFDLVASAPNTVDAHRLILHARRLGLEWPVAGALLRAYFTEGRNLDDPETLLDVAQHTGLDREDVAALLASTELHEDVLASQRDAQRLGISGVPFYVLDGRYGVSGAQPPETFLRALERIQSERPAAAT
ncbi:DsbA family protein [soil metagenome]